MLFRSVWVNLRNANVRGAHVHFQHLIDLDFTECRNLGELVVTGATLQLSADGDYSGLSGREAMNWKAIHRAGGPAPKPQPKTSKGCYIASAIYGSYDCPQVWVLRRFRDDVLARTAVGRSFIRTYYSLSPHIVKMCGSTMCFNWLGRRIIDALVGILKYRGFSDTPYADHH